MKHTLAFCFFTFCSLPILSADPPEKLTKTDILCSIPEGRLNMGGRDYHVYYEVYERTVHPIKDITSTEVYPDLVAFDDEEELFKQVLNTCNYVWLTCRYPQTAYVDPARESAILPNPFDPGFYQRDSHGALLFGDNGEPKINERLLRQMIGRGGNVVTVHPCAITLEKDLLDPTATSREKRIICRSGTYAYQYTVYEGWVCINNSLYSVCLYLVPTGSVEFGGTLPPLPREAFDYLEKKGIFDFFIEGSEDERLYLQVTNLRSLLQPLWSKFPTFSRPQRCPFYKKESAKRRAGPVRLFRHLGKM